MKLDSQKVAAWAGILGGIVTLYIVGVWAFTHLTEQNRARIHEQEMVSKLRAGDDYTRLQQVMGELPDRTRTLESGRTLFQFDRRWEYIIFLVSRDRVLSVGVYSKSKDFKPVLSAGGETVVLNESPISRYDDSGVGAVASCGSHIEFFFEGYSLSHAFGFSSFLLGWIPFRTNEMPGAACAAGLYSSFPVSRCLSLDKGSALSGLSGKYLGCLRRTQVGKELEHLRPSVAIITAPGQPILSDMWFERPLIG